MYDYLIVGSGLFGSIYAYEMHKKGKKCIVIEKRNHFGGNIYCEERDNIKIHSYGAHIFHTSNDKVWDYINNFAKFNNFINSPIAVYKNELYNLPFNMNTFSKMWNIKTPDEARAIIEEQRKKITHTPANLEEQAISLVGTDIYEKLIKGYTEKQWGKPCSELPAFIIKRLPVRYSYDNNYFNDKYQGIPIDGYNSIINKMLHGIETKINTNFFEDRAYFESIAKKIVYTGPIDEFYNYKLGQLEYRGLKFETSYLDTDNYQGVAVVNYTEREIPYTRIIEHKHFEFGTQKGTYITKEYPVQWKVGDEAYYPVNNELNNSKYLEYKNLAQGVTNVIFGGRLGEYKYYDMDKVIESALESISKELHA